jgi:hypothetical protein
MNLISSSGLAANVNNEKFASSNTSAYQIKAKLEYIE